MEDEEIKNYSRFLYEILIKKESEILGQIKSLKLTAISQSYWDTISEAMMNGIKDQLIDWEINTPSFECITSPENSSKSFRYLLEIVQNNNQLNFEKLKLINDSLKNIKRKPKLETLFDFVEPISELIDELKEALELYKLNSDIRISAISSLTDFATKLYQILNKLASFVDNDVYIDAKDLHKSIEEYMAKLIELSFVISEYPPKIIKKATSKQTGTHFSTTISCLIEKDGILFNPKFKVFYLTEENLKSYLNGKSLPNDCEIHYKDIKPSNNKWILQNMVWNPKSKSDSKEPKRNNQNRITDLKAVLLFHVKITPNSCGLAYQFKLNTELYSDPVVSVVHSSQEVEAYLTLFWDDYFRRNREFFLTMGSFECETSVSIKDLIDAVSDYFFKQTSRELTASNKDFLVSKLFSQLRNTSITFQLFARTNMPGSENSFGRWIFLIVKLLRLEGTISLWKDHLINGFVEKDVNFDQPILSQGTFLLRFSEKNPKIGVVLKTGTNWNAWSPFSLEECRVRSLPSRLMEYSELLHIVDANGKVRNKNDCVTKFIDHETTDEGYTQRGYNLNKLLEEGIYTDFSEVNLMDFENDASLGDISDVPYFQNF